MAMEDDLSDQAYPSPSPSLSRTAASISTYKLRNGHNRKQCSGIKQLFRDFGDWHNLSLGSAGMGWWVWSVDVSCVWPYNCISSGLGSERILSFSKGQALLLLMDLCAEDQRTPVVERISSRLSMVFPLPVSGCGDRE